VTSPNHASRKVLVVIMLSTRLERLLHILLPVVRQRIFVYWTYREYLIQWITTPVCFVKVNR